MGVKEFDQLGEIGKRPGQTVHLVDHDDIGFAGPNPGEQRLQGGAVKGGAGIRAVVVAPAGEAPAFVRLAFDIGLASLALGVQRIEREVQIMLGGFSRVDGAAEKRLARLIHALNPGLCQALPLGRTEERLRFGDFSACGGGFDAGATPASGMPGRRKPKKRGPFQAVPVMARAIAERLKYVRSCQRKPSGTMVTVWRSPWYSRTRTVPAFRRRFKPWGFPPRASRSSSLTVSRSRPAKASAWMR